MGREGLDGFLLLKRSAEIEIGGKYFNFWCFLLVLGCVWESFGEFSANVLGVGALFIRLLERTFDR